MAEKFNPLGLISATRTESSHLSGLLAEAGFKVKDLKAEAGLDWIAGEFFNRKTLLLRSGVGKTSAAMATQFLIDRFQPKMIINLGVAGALNREMKQGTVLVADSCQEWDVDLSAIYLQALAPIFPASAIELSPILSVLASSVSSGRIITGDAFVANQGQRETLAKKFMAVAVDMESAAIAKVATANGIPFFVIKGISDHANTQATVDLEKNLKSATAASFRILQAILENNLI
ncbi:MAG: 5'-methylthioadenosine/S-adenosylhomocysteine nucleosidase [Patescibacteria group bacterium]|nr:5'-methylthioadenosine/S-adenosylhomocysteine nucleosidase [Patescibacteria group bacterium]